MTMLQYTPELTLFDSSSLILNVGASLSLFQGPRALCRRIQASLSTAGMPKAQIGMAPTALGAWILARQKQTKQRRVLQVASLIRLLNPLPTSILPVTLPYHDWLHNLGCTTLIHLVRLPRPGLNQRTSPLIGEYLDAAYGKRMMHLAWYQPPEIFHASRTLEFHTTQVPTLLISAQHLIEQLCGWLQARRLAASALTFSLHHEKGRHACPPTCITISLSEPAWHDKKFSLLLREHLQNLQLIAPVIALELHDIQSQTQCVSTNNLFPDQAHYQHQENQLVDLLQARLGRHNVLQPYPQDTYVPEKNNRWIPYYNPSRTLQPHTTSRQKSQSEAQSETSRCHPRRPFWMLEHPVRLSTRNDRPQYQGRALQLIRGPERIESGWWMNGHHEQRDYFIAHDHLHCWYWIYRQRDTGNPHWFLQGLFG